MPTLKTTPLILPESQIVCQLALSYFDQLEVQKSLVGLPHPSTWGTEALTEDQFEKILQFQKTLILRGVKSWTDADAINDLAISQLGQADIAALVEGLTAFVHPSLDVQDKKKEVSIPVPSSADDGNMVA